MKLSIVIPAYNEEKRIRNTLINYYNYFNGIYKNDFEIFVVVNGSNDNTVRIVDEISKKYKQIKYIDIPGRIGKGGAIIEGFKRVDGNLIGFVDADMATAPDSYYDLVSKIKNYDGIVASRWIKGAIINRKQPLQRRIASRAFNLIVKALFGINIRDTQCVHGSTEIYGYLNDEPIRVDIKRLANILDTRVINRGKSYIIYEIKDKFLVPSLNNEACIELARANVLIVREDNKRLYEIKLDGGRTTKVSENHPILVYKYGYLKYETASNLKIGDKLPVLVKLNKNSFGRPRTHINFIEEVKNKIPWEMPNFRVYGWRKLSKIKSVKDLAKKLGINYNTARNYFKANKVPLNYLEKLKIKKIHLLKISYKGGKVKIPIFTKINKDLLRFIGYFLAEGCMDNDDANRKNRHAIRLSFNNNEQDLISENGSLLKSLFSIKTKVDTRNNVSTIEAQARILCILFRDLLGLGTIAKEKKLPNFIYCLDNKLIGHLLDAYFLGDGHISKHKMANSINIRANSASEKLIKDIQFLLLKYGVTSSVYTSTRGKEEINGRKLSSSGKYRYNLSVHMGNNSLKLLKFMPIVSKKYYNIVSMTRGRNPCLFQRSDHRYNADLGLARIIKIKRTRKISTWYDFKIQSREKPNMNFVHDCGIISHNCGAKLFTNKAVKSVVNELGITQWGFDVDLLYLLRKKDFKVIEIPTTWYDQEGSKLRVARTSWQMFLSMIRLRLIYSRFIFIVKAYDKIHDSFFKK